MNIDMITAAANRFCGHARVTPLLNAPLLDAAYGKRVFLRAQCLQLTGRFKFRASWALCPARPDRRPAVGDRHARIRAMPQPPLPLPA